MMRNFAMAALIALAAPAHAAEPARSTLGVAATAFDMHAKANGADYRVHVALPQGAKPGVRYPVVYVLDADGHFPLFAETARVLADAEDIPPLVVVGIGYPVASFADTIPLRLRDYTPVADPPHEELVRKIVGEGTVVVAGGADAFLAFIEDELKPAIAARYPVDNANSALFGHSLGGLFGLHVLLTRPESFQRYGLSSPPILWADGDILKREAAYAASHKDLATRLFLAVGGEERTLAHVLALPPALKAEETRIVARFGNPDPVAQLADFDARLRARHYSGLCYGGVRVFDGESHGSVVVPAFGAGLRALFGQRK